MEYLIVDVVSRQITIPESITHIGVKDDNETRTLKFKMPSVYKGLDMSGYTIEINYINAKNKSDSALAENVQVGDGEITFEWCVGGTAYAKDGIVRFLVYTYLENEDGVKTNEWHTTWARLPVLDGGNVEEQIAVENPRIIEEMLRRIEELEKGGTSDETIAEAVSDWLAENPIEAGTPDAVQYVEQKLTDEQQTQARTNIGAASADEVGKLQEHVNDLKGSQTSGISAELTGALVNYYTHVLPNFNDANGMSYINAILTALGAETRGEADSGGEENPDTGETEVTLSSISVNYTGGSVAVGTALTSLTGITVTATYSDGSTANVTDYTLSGEIAEGENTITVTYEGLTSTFTVTGVAESSGEDSEPFVNLFEGMTWRNTGYSGTDIDNGLPVDRYINDEDMTFEAGVTYYSYMPSSTNTLAILIYANNGDDTYSSSGVSATRNSFYFNGNYDSWNKEKEDTEYLIADGIYLMEHKFTPTETFSGKLCYQNKCEVNTYPDYAYLFTKEYNPYMDTLE